MSSRARPPRAPTTPAASGAASNAPLHPPLRVDQGRLLVPVRVVPRASRVAVDVVDDGLRVRLTAPPVDGAANTALIALLAERLRLPRQAITLVRGATARHKLLAIAGIAPDDFWRRLGL
jgi:uncharacterized protein (TIGR00251 family)